MLFQFLFKLSGRYRLAKKQRIPCCTGYFSQLSHELQGYIARNEPAKIRSPMHIRFVLIKMMFYKDYYEKNIALAFCVYRFLTSLFFQLYPLIQQDQAGLETSKVDVRNTNEIHYQ